MNSKQRKTLQAIFHTPIRSDVPWTDIVNLFVALGGTVSEGRRSRIRVVLNDVVATFHRPHPQATTDKGTVKSVRYFLSNAGIRYDEL